ncbi:hypothetical protein GCM10022231_22460 [Gordonia caeni]|uniref:Uncharacterized protein n=1 Tax=Gordonia caeni TaxID=1007097 RepID=A0ABP7P9A9_9ACTN
MPPPGPGCRIPGSVNRPGYRRVCWLTVTTGGTPDHPVRTDNDDGIDWSYQN